MIGLYKLLLVHAKLERFLRITMNANDIGIANLIANEGYFVFNHMIGPIVLKEMEKNNNGDF